MTALLVFLGVVAVLAGGIGFMFYSDRKQQRQIRQLTEL